MPLHRHAEVGELEHLEFVLRKIPGEVLRVMSDEFDRDPFDVGLADVAHAGGADPGRVYNPIPEGPKPVRDAENGTSYPAILTNTLTGVIPCVPKHGAAREGFQYGT